MANDFRIDHSFAASGAIKCGNWHAPDALARHAPVGPAFQHIAHTIAAPARNPFHSLVNFTQGHRPQCLPRLSAVAGAIHRDEPLWRRSEEHTSELQSQSNL